MLCFGHRFASVSKWRKSKRAQSVKEGKYFFHRLKLLCIINLLQVTDNSRDVKYLLTPCTLWILLPTLASLWVAVAVGRNQSAKEGEQVISTLTSGTTKTLVAEKVSICLLLAG